MVCLVFGVPHKTDMKLLMTCMPELWHAVHSSCRYLFAVCSALPQCLAANCRMPVCMADHDCGAYNSSSFKFCLDVCRWGPELQQLQAECMSLPQDCVCLHMKARLYILTLSRTSRQPAIVMVLMLALRLFKLRQWT